MALCPQAVSQAPQYFRPPKVQGTCDGCIAHQSVFLVISLHSGMPRTVHPGGWKALLVTANFDTRQSGLSIVLFTFCSKLITHDCNNQQNTCSLHLLIYFSMECRRRRFTPKPLAKWETDPSEILHAIFFPSPTVSGYTCEAHNNPPDFFLDVINGDSTAVTASSGNVKSET